MGANASCVTMSPNQPSPGDRAHKSVCTNSLSKLMFSDESFWRHFALRMREPVHIPGWASILGLEVTKHSVTELEDGSLVVRDVISGYYGSEVDVNMQHRFDSETNTWIQTCDRDPNLQKVPLTMYYRLHPQPQRIFETWCMTGAAKSGGIHMVEVLRTLLGAVLDLHGISLETVELNYDQPSLDGSGLLVAQTGPVVGISPETFLKGLVKLVRDGMSSPNLVRIEIKDLPDGSFLAKETIDSDSGTYMQHVIYRLDKSTDEFRAEHLQTGNCKDGTHAFIFRAFRHPFRLELHCEVYAKRHSGEDVLDMARPHIETAIQNALEEPSSPSIASTTDAVQLRRKEAAHAARPGGQNADEAQNSLCEIS
eukprot:TRINITY_DN6440_c0_g1_i1.p1 TRINITY_DN6440_c0_g1~~TRINITY_DN6440_c0_g1_i1.p1  ORF type:complete len:367 (+),score=51.24 TRINITY_DN6440_c0_g1_i1:168-1268(+)